MDWLFDASVVTVLLAVRLGIPVAVIFSFGFLVRYLDGRWHGKTT